MFLFSKIGEVHHNIMILTMKICILKCKNLTTINLGCVEPYSYIKNSMKTYILKCKNLTTINLGCVEPYGYIENYIIIQCNLEPCLSLFLKM